MSEKSKAEPASNVVNSLRALRMAKGLSQGQLADGALITRQAVCAIEADQYLPTTAVALRLASVLGCHVEDIFSLKTTGELIEGEWVWPGMVASAVQPRTRVKVAKIEDRYVVRPVAALGEILNYTVPADGLIIGRPGPAGVQPSPTAVCWYVCYVSGRSWNEKSRSPAVIRPSIWRVSISIGTRTLRRS